MMRPPGGFDRRINRGCAWLRDIDIPMFVALWRERRRSNNNAPLTDIDVAERLTEMARAELTDHPRPLITRNAVHRFRLESAPECVPASKKWSEDNCPDDSRLTLKVIWGTAKRVCEDRKHARNVTIYLAAILGHKIADLARAFHLDESDAYRIAEGQRAAVGYGIDTGFAHDVESVLVEARRSVGGYSERWLTKGAG